VSAANRARGAFGERIVARWYEAQGFTVIDRNWRDGGRGELDLVLSRNGLVVFCEVKARASAAFGDPLEAIDARKVARVRRLAAAWLAAHAVRPDEIRIDAASVLGAKVAVVEGIG
jgi:putative endonuclease